MECLERDSLHCKMFFEAANKGERNYRYSCFISTGIKRLKDLPVLFMERLSLTSVGVVSAL